VLGGPVLPNGTAINRHMGVNNVTINRRGTSATATVLARREATG